jgi:hypothetical protein
MSRTAEYGDGPPTMSKGGLIVAIGAAASVITILTFVTGVPNLPDFSKRISQPTAERNSPTPSQASSQNGPTRLEPVNNAGPENGSTKEQETQDAERQRMAEAAQRQELQRQRDQEEARKKVEQAIEPHQTSSLGPFTLILDRITRLGSTLLVEMVITSTRDNSDICVITHGGGYSPFRNTALYDQDGNEYNPTRAVIGNRDVGGGTCLGLVTGIPTRTKITFDNFPQNGTVSALALSWGTHWYISPGNSEYNSYISTYRNIR